MRERPRSQGRRSIRAVEHDFREPLTADRRSGGQRGSPGRPKADLRPLGRRSRRVEADGAVDGAERRPPRLGKPADGFSTSFHTLHFLCSSQKTKYENSPANGLGYQDGFAARGERCRCGLVVSVARVSRIDPAAVTREGIPELQRTFSPRFQAPCFSLAEHSVRDRGTECTVHGAENSRRREVAKPGIALGSGPRDRGFESRLPDSQRAHPSRHRITGHAISA
jgi:hypothetical protein